VKKKLRSSRILWFMGALALIAFVMAPLFNIPVVVMEEVEIQREREIQTITREAVIEETSFEETIFDDELILVGWSTFGYRWCELELEGKDNPLVEGRIRFLPARIKDDTGWHRIRRGRAFAVLDQHNFYLFVNFSSLSVVNDYVYLTMPYGNISYPATEKFSFIPTQTKYYFVFDNIRGVFDREVELDITLLWTEEVKTWDETTDVEVQEYYETGLIPQVEYRKKSLLQLLF